MLSGILLILLGAWGALIPFIGPIFDYAYTPDNSWHYTNGRLWLEILPGAAAVLGGLILLASANRLVSMWGGWLAAAAGAWFVVGQPLSTLWNDGVPAAGVPSSASTTGTAMEQIGFFYGLGAVIVFLASVALGRMSVVGVKDLESARRKPRETSRDDQSHYDDHSRRRRLGRPTSKATDAETSDETQATTSDDSTSVERGDSPRTS